jgi:hypothetical protein
MRARTNAGRLLAGLAAMLLLAGCAAGAQPTPVPATPTPLATPSLATGTPAPSPTAAPTVVAPSPQPTAIAYDGSTAVLIHIDEPECVTADAGTTTYVSGVRQMRGWGRHCRYDAADARFSGWSDIVVNSDCYSADNANCVRWGTERIPGPDGDWVGTFQGVGFVEAVRCNMEILAGTGAYEGWTVVWYMDMAAHGGEEWVIDGLIYQGPPPPMPPLPSPVSQVDAIG